MIRDKVDIFLSPSETVASFFKGLGVPSSRIVLSRYGFKRSAIEFRRKTFTKDSKLVFGYTGRIIPTKGIGLLLEAFKDFEGSKHELQIFGDDSSVRPYLERKRPSNAHFMGGYDNRKIDDVLNQIDVLVVPSTWLENSPLVIQEAFLKGMPVITSDLGGMAELVEDGVNGFLFKPGNVDSLSHVIGTCIDDPTILNHLDIDPSVVRDREEEIGTMMELYKELIGGPTF
jgi:glycosyltransferase involved in cell wall biosynthesis